MMELYATGFNAWDQLSFSPHENSHSRPDDESEPHDLLSFTKVLSAKNLERPVARLSYTIVRADGLLRISGLGPSSIKELEFLYSAVETVSGEILTIRDNVGAGGSNVLVKYPSLSSWKSDHEPQNTWLCAPPAKQIAAFNTGFAILYADGSVCTLGDPRFEACLGRDISPELPATAPGPVPDLHDLSLSSDPVRHVTAGGSSVAVLTRQSGSVYVWGSGTNPSPSAVSDSMVTTTSTTAKKTAVKTYRLEHAFRNLCSVTNYTEIDGGKDVSDVALGEGHAIALTTDQAIYVIGINSNGQLGLGRAKGVDEWTKVPFEAAAGHEIVGVAAGPRSSFILTSEV